MSLTAIAIAFAGYVIVDNYAVGESSSEDILHVTIQFLTPTSGQDAIALVCRDVTTGELEGGVDIDTLGPAVHRSGCCHGRLP